MADVNKTSRETSTEPFEELQYPPCLPSTYANIPTEDSDTHQAKPLSKVEFTSLQDSDGRLVDEHRLRKFVFRGGVDPKIRREVWQFLFGLYPCISTAREREVRLIGYYTKYRALKAKWQSALTNDPTCSKLVCPPYLKNDGELSPTEDEIKSFSRQSSLSELQGVLGRPVSEDLQAQLAHNELLAKVNAGRERIDMDILKSAIRIIDKDVPRTDRDTKYFSGVDNPHLHMLRNILITYAAFHSDVNYTQGMNDVLSRFLMTFDNETEAYWCFTEYLEQFKSDFMEDGLNNKLELSAQLLSEVDPELFRYLEHLGVSDMTFCHRWLLLGFKREFTLSDSLRCFEIISSHHLELSSLEAEKLLEAEQKKNFTLQGGKTRTAAVTANTAYTFDVFMCVAILVQHRKTLFDCQEVTNVFETISKLSSQLKLDSILWKAENLFLQYCRSSASNCFQMVDNPASWDSPDD